MATASIPKSIGPYRIKAILGEGGMGRVFRAEQPSLQREVALKVLGEGLIGRSDLGERFLREARAMARISHPNVITCFDVGKTEDGLLYMALEIVDGGDASQLLKKRGNRMAEDEALAIVRDAAAGLDAIEAAGLIHRDIKPANIFMTSRGAAKLADLGLARDDANDQLTSPGVPVGTPAYMSPEQAQGQQDLDIRTDIYALGATLWCFLMGVPPFTGDSPVATLVKTLNDPLPDPLRLRGDLGAATVDILKQALAKDRGQRFQRAKDLEQACARALSAASGANLAIREPMAGLSQQPASEPGVPVPAPAPPSPPAAKPEPAPASVPEPTMTAVREEPSAQRPKSDSGTAGRLDAGKLNRRQLLALSKRIHITEDGLQAFLNLGPEASFPYELLEKLLEVTGVQHGLIPGSLVEASRRSPMPRRIILAEGDASTPGVAGRDIRGNDLAPFPDPVMVSIADDQMAAYALFRPGELVDQKAVERAVRKTLVRFGIDRAAITRLWEGPPSQSGRVRIAAGVVVQQGTPAGFNIAGGVAEASLTGGEVQNLAEVTAGTVLATWEEEVPGRAGMDIYGHKVDPDPLPTLRPDDQAGEGTDLHRGKRGALELRAAVSGYVQQRFDGSIRVVNAVEVKGDLTADSDPIDSDEVVVVRGSVQAGAKISCASDVVIMGDLSDAAIEAGGSVEVHGNVKAGVEPVMAVDQLKVVGEVARKVVAGNLRIAGTVDRCELIASGDISVNKIIGGSLKAGGSVTCDYAGDRYGTTTELYAGTNPGYEEQAKMAKLAERKFKAEQERLQTVAKRFQGEVSDLNRKKKRHDNAAWVNEKMIERQRAYLERIEQQQQEALAQADAARAQLAEQRGVINSIRHASADPNASIEVRMVAHGGVVASIAGSDPIRLKEDIQGYRLGRRRPEADSD